MDPEMVLARLCESLGLTLVRPTLLSEGRARVMRYLVASESGPQTVIVKTADPESMTFRRELAAYRVLPVCSTSSAAVPRLMGALPEHGVLVLEDITPGTRLLDLLLGDDRIAACAGLGKTSHALGALHASGRSARDRFTVQLGADQPDLHEQATSFERAFPALHAFIAALGIRATPAFAGALEKLSRHIAAGGQDTTLTLGDIAPTNVLFRSGEAVFIDFEYCGIRHPFYDSMFWRCMCAFPPDVCDAMERDYRRGLTENGWTFDDDRFDRAMVDTAAHRLFWMLGWSSTAELLEDDRRAPPTRALVLHYFTEFLRLAEGRPHDPALVAMAEACLASLFARWEDRPVDASFPAFAGSAAAL
jgi:aminoglycoside/choline kinase family phosphotransferase